MKRLGLTQRVDFIASHQEWRDCLDVRWYSFAESLGFIPVPLPTTTPEQAATYIETFGLDAVCFTGGNTHSLADAAAPDASPKRDAFEAALLTACLAKDIPVLGVCRGLQMINLVLGGRVEKIENHVAVRHPVTFNGQQVDVNSYHSCAVPQSGLAENLQALAVDVDGNVEAFQHKSKKLLAFMWHPEREEKFNAGDINLIRKVWA